MLGSTPISVHIRNVKWFSRVVFAFLLVAAAAFGAAAGLVFVYQSELPEVKALEDYRPDTVTELYSDEGQLIGSFSLQRRILVTFDQIPTVLSDAVLSAEDQHFYDHWGIDLPRVLQAAWHNVAHFRKAEGASTLTMQLAGGLFLDRTDRSFRRKIQEALLAIQIERYYTKRQIFTLYCNQIYLGHGNYGFEAASQFYFGKSLRDLKLTEAALLAGIIPGPKFSPVLHPERAKIRRGLVLARMAADGKITREDAEQAARQPLGVHVLSPRNDFAPYFIEEIRKYLEHNYGTEAVHERGLRVYTTLSSGMQRAANAALREGLHSYGRRHGWHGELTNILSEAMGTLQTYEHDDWRRAINKGDYVTALVTEVDDKTAVVKIGTLHAVLTRAEMTWTAQASPARLLHVGDLVVVHVKDIGGTIAKVDLDQEPAAQASFLAIDNASGEVKAMIGGYSFDDSKFNRATQAMRQVGSSFKPYLYSTAIEQGHDPFETIVDAPFTTQSGGQAYSPHNYDGKFEGRITLRRALAGSRNIPAVKLGEEVGITNVVDMTRRFGITSPLPPYLPLVLGAAEITLMEHTSAFTVFPNDGIRIEPHLIRRVITYDGSVLEEARPHVYDVIKPEVARTMTAMLEEVVQFGTAQRAKELKRPVAGKTGTTNDFSDAWFIGFTPSLTAGVWIGYDDKRITLGKKESGARAALPIWLEFMKTYLADKPVEEFANVEPLAKLAVTRQVSVDTPDSAPTEDDFPGGVPPKKTVAPPGAPEPPTAVAPPAKTAPVDRPGASSQPQL
ncbi:MAG: PBP1A family penicillin-binding protein [Acidipila sp.]|nr:PBP1A family penicillin-binding protein [Acidipila sp.]